MKGFHTRTVHTYIVYYNCSVHILYDTHTLYIRMYTGMGSSITESPGSPRHGERVTPTALGSPRRGLLPFLKSLLLLLCVCVALLYFSSSSSFLHITVAHLPSSFSSFCVCVYLFSSTDFWFESGNIVYILATLSGNLLLTPLTPCHVISSISTFCSFRLPPALSPSHPLLPPYFHTLLTHTTLTTRCIHIEQQRVYTQKTSLSLSLRPL